MRKLISYVSYVGRLRRPTGQGTKRSRADGQVGKGGVKRGTRGVTGGKKRGRNAYHERESEGEEAVHACSVTAHDLYKGMGNLYMASRNFGEL